MLCSRAITREKAAMSGSIAAFVFIRFSKGQIMLCTTEAKREQWNGGGLCVSLRLSAFA